MQFAFQEAFKGNPTSNFEVELSASTSQSSARPVCLLLSATARLSSQGDIIGVICVGQDITNIKDIEETKKSHITLLG